MRVSIGDQKGEVVTGVMVVIMVVMIFFGGMQRNAYDAWRSPAWRRP
jgi:hypothetical protein